MRATSGLFFKRIATIGLVVLLVAVIGGCTSINKSGLNQSEAPQPVEPLERPIIEPKEWIEEETADDFFAKIAQQVPAFGGMFIDEKDSITVYLTDLSPSAAATAEVAIRTVFGDDERLQRPMRTLKGQYGFLQLKKWHDSMIDVLAIPGVVSTDIDDGKNRLTVGVEAIELAHEVEKMLDKLGIPREAVNIEEEAPPEFKLRQRRRPLVGGLQIQFGWPGANCTLGFIAVREGVNGFVTNSHCTHTQGGVEKYRVSPTNKAYNSMGHGQ